jgi:membrane-bound metal-dependent hydrolase YbcI (DUF457 family)
MASPVGHLAFGAAAAAVVARATGTPDSPALWLGAAVACGIPDVDVVFQLLGHKRLHRNATHSLPFAALVIAAGLALMGALRVTPGPGLWGAWVAALLSHDLLDVITTGPTLGRIGWGIPLLWPLSRKRFWVRHPFLVGDRTESETYHDTLREMREDAVRLVPPCAAVFLLARAWPWG